MTHFISDTFQLHNKYLKACNDTREKINAQSFHKFVFQRLEEIVQDEEDNRKYDHLPRVQMSAHRSRSTGNFNAQLGIFRGPGVQGCFWRGAEKRWTCPNLKMSAPFFVESRKMSKRLGRIFPFSHWLPQYSRFFFRFDNFRFWHFQQIRSRMFQNF